MATVKAIIVLEAVPSNLVTDGGNSVKPQA